MTITEIKDFWPDWRIEFACEYATEKLRNLLGINFVYLRNKGWEEWLDGTEFCIHIIFEDKITGDFKELVFYQEIFVEDFLPIDDKIGANKLHGLRDKVILRIAWQLKESFEGRS